ncbi:MAG: hypothetical protein KKF48_05510 [Nanoarchaeota archaeon]|nr:hypothetical protein [Nanoarchaeota archaeon]MBU1028474.1 hypothetical protein [Nanoarchaeota archaeon]
MSPNHLGKDLLSSGNLRVINPMIKPEGLQKKVMDVTEKIKESGADIFRLKELKKGKSRDIWGLDFWVDRNFKSALRSMGILKYNSLFSFNVSYDENNKKDKEEWEDLSKGIWKKEGIIIKNISFEVGNPLLEYRPFEVNFQDGNPTEDIEAEDFLDNKLYTSKRNNFIELNGVTSIGQKSSKGQKAIPFLIDTARKLKQYLDKIPEEAIIKVSFNPTPNTWFFPLFEIPIIVRKRAIFYDTEITKKGMNYNGYPTLSGERSNSVYEHTVSFEESGALVFDGYAGKLFDSTMNNWYFNEVDKSSMDSDYTIKCIKKGLFENPHQFRSKFSKVYSNHINSAKNLEKALELEL